MSRSNLKSTWFHRYGSALAAAVVGINATGAGAQTVCNELQKLLPSDGAAVDGFGSSVAISGSIAIIGAPGDDETGEKSGSVYVNRFDGTSWSEEQKLSASDGAPFDGFGGSVSIDANVAIVGASHDDNENGTDAGSAYVYRFNGAAWTQEQKLLASDGTALAEFGICVSISGDVAIVGAAGDDDGGSSSGSAYVYRHDGVSWTLEHKLLASDGAAGDEFGRSVSVSGDVAIVGTWADDDDGESSGSAYVYRFDGVSWIEEQKLLASDGAAGDEFGWSASISADKAIVAAPGDDDSNASSGSTYVYRFDGTSWLEEQKLLSWEGWADDLFGSCVSILGDAAIVGAPGAGLAYVYRYDGVSWSGESWLNPVDGTTIEGFGHSVSMSADTALVGLDSGRAFPFRFDGAWWSVEEWISPSDATADDEFGGSVCVSGDVAIIGAIRSGENGAAYVYRHDGVSWTEEQKLVALNAAFPFGAAVSISGDVAIVGAPSDQAAYVYRDYGVAWALEQRLVASDSGPFESFGGSVSISGDVAIVGALSDNNENGNDAGSAYVYRYNGVSWTEEQKLLASDGQAGVHFGVSVSMSGETAIVGAHWSGEGPGAAYVYRYDGSTWTEEQKLVDSDGASGDAFARSVSISGDVAIVGAHLDDDNGFNAGSAFLYRHDGVSWTEEQKLLGAGGSGTGLFGKSVSIDGDRSVVGTSYASVYVYRHDGVSWTEDEELRASDWAVDDGFGRSVAISGDAVIVGAPLDDDNGGRSGSAYVFASVDACPSCAGDTDGDGQVDVTDLLAMLADWGTDGSGHNGDVDGSSLVDVSDMLMILAAWGTCP